MKNPAHIILVEDNPADVHLIRYALEQTEIRAEISHFENGELFLQFLEQHPEFRPSFLLLDLNMPLLSGHQVLESLRHNPVYNYLPVIIFTSSGSPSDVERAYNLGANAYVRKPLELDELVDKMRTLADFWLKVNLYP